MGNLPRLQSPFKDKLVSNVNAAAKKLLASEDYDPQFGARPLKRAIQQHVLDPLVQLFRTGLNRRGAETQSSDKNRVQRKDAKARRREGAKARSS